jgi:hypothetical protein
MKRWTTRRAAVWRTRLAVALTVDAADAAHCRALLGWLAGWHGPRLFFAEEAIEREQFIIKPARDSITANRVHLFSLPLSLCLSV